MLSVGVNFPHDAWKEKEKLSVLNKTQVNTLTLCVFATWKKVEITDTA